MLRPIGYAAAGLLVLGGAGWLVERGAGPAQPARAAATTGIAVVSRTNVIASQIVGGTLGYADPVVLVASAGQGVITWLPAPGAVVSAGQALYEVDGRPVSLWYGARPAWRDFRPGMPDGPDVRQLEQALASLGFGRGLAVDDHFTAATAAAIGGWQHAHGWPRTGQIPLGQVVFQPGPVRVAAVAAALGTPLQPGTTILTSTSTTKVVTVNLDPARRLAVHAGEHVSIALSTGQSTTGTVSAVGAPSTRATADSANATVPTVPVTITLDQPAAAAGADAGPVQVALVTAERDGVLAVPIDALLAAPGGGYRVAVLDSAGRQLVPVRTGLFDDSHGIVEITGAVAAGDRVEVPSP